MAGTAPKAAPDDIRLIGGNVNGRYTLSSRSGIRCFACRAQSISPRSMSLTAPVSGEIGDRVALHFDDLGLLRGKIVRLLEFGFIIDIIAEDADRAAMATKIRWLKQRVLQHAAEQRRHKRLIPRSPRSSLVLADGTRIDCFIMNMSAAGAAVSADYTPRLGQVLAVGRAVGRVVRYLEVGFAVQFAQVHDPEHLDKMLERIED